MSTQYKKASEVPTEALVSRLNELSKVFIKDDEERNRELTMRVPAELDRDADLVTMGAAIRLEQLSAQLAEYQAREAQLRDALEKISDGDIGRPHKVDKCIHGKYGFECCEECYGDFAREALTDTYPTSIPTDT